MNTLQRSLIAALAGLAMALPASAATYAVTVDTSSLAGETGYLDFGFAGLADSPAAISTIFGLAGGSALGAAQLDGAASITTGGWQLGTGEAFNAVFQSWQFGSQLSFSVDFSGDWLSAGSGSGNSFSLKLWDGAVSNTLLTADGAGDVLRFELSPGGSIGVETFARDAFGTPSAVQVSAVPEPQTYAMLLAGLALLGAAKRRRAG
ncbi:NF038129 family PEP-CTERM protein [Niveibacterium sp. 24ML]|uniref:NF038129 family PEP-CTERM protein n=1 Tax=Niveibacterium sp. 24ML TaxID=2985512 RepID=UPI00226DD234|nr:NF038129 family PEP-CTERM protein [Niveibacterium sp. 24ML]MCX9156379.1 NF038129 family PEP-CTERM protein [Niveibacterium sp. 24ML]